MGEKATITEEEAAQIIIRAAQQHHLWATCDAEYVSIVLDTIARVRKRDPSREVQDDRSPVHIDVGHRLNLHLRDGSTDARAEVFGKVLGFHMGYNSGTVEITIELHPQVK